MHFLSWGFILIGCAGVMVVLAGVGLLLFFLLRRKQPPRGFDVLPKK